MNCSYDISFKTIRSDDLLWEWEEIIIPNHYYKQLNKKIFTKKDIPRLPRHPLQPEDCTAHKQAYIDFIQSSINYDFHLSPI